MYERPGRRGKRFPKSAVGVARRIGEPPAARQGSGAMPVSPRTTAQRGERGSRRRPRAPGLARRQI